MPNIDEEKLDGSKLARLRQEALERVYIRKLNDKLEEMSAFSLVDFRRLYRSIIKVMVFGVLAGVLFTVLNTDIAVKLLITIGQVTVGIFGVFFR